MSTRTVTCLTAISLIGALAIPAWPVARADDDTRYPYIAVDIGTLGGPTATFDIPGQIVTNSGMVLAQADTSAADTDYPNNNPFIGSDPYIEHGVIWHRGVLSDLGALPGKNSSAIFEINARGDGAGASENGAINPLTGIPETDAVLWQDGHIFNLGTLGGHDSFATWINNRGQVVGFATNTIPDPFTLATWSNVGTQMRAVLWQDGTVRDLGTLGGPDSAAAYVNGRGQVAGVSLTNASSNVVTGQPTEDPFLWTDGHMQDLGTLGGTYGFPTASGHGLNDRGEVVGASDLKGDLASHPFLWDGTSMKDLGTFGGHFGEAHAINEDGDVVGWATPTGDRTAHAALWKDGEMTDLGTVPGQPCSFADSINARDQVVGGTCIAHDTGDGWLWEHGTFYDLNTLIAPSAMRVEHATYINDRGEIAAYGVLPNGEQHIVLLLPRDEGDREGLTQNTPPGAHSPVMATQANPESCGMMLPWRARPARGSYLPCIGG